jgi:hypothetical protein
MWVGMEGGGWLVIDVTRLKTARRKTQEKSKPDAGLLEQDV